jgi:Predicted membrane protein
MSPRSLVPSEPPDRGDAPWYVAPLPEWLESAGLRLVVPIVLVNLVGTAFGFWYYGFHPLPLSDPLIVWQLAGEPPAMWAFVPDSPVATGFVAVALGLWWLGRPSEYWNVLAFFGCWKLGLWTPFVLAAFADGFLATTPVPMYAFLFVSHLGMAVEAFLLYRISEFPTKAILVAAVWYGVNDLVDYFVPLVGTPHHTLLPGQVALESGLGFTHPTPDHWIAAAGAVALTVTGTALAVATRRYHAGRE